ncbi:uncharacterized protein LOC134336880 isoform X2 [Mobula hypostoma]|uniref:uncharacterized protein LOC134336880 isoform X2 n=1 Tax=Mobula hypostoma TaxID=723540 RepID=UPI002FC3797F
MRLRFPTRVPAGDSLKRSNKRQKPERGGWSDWRRIQVQDTGTETDLDLTRTRNQDLDLTRTRNQDLDLTRTRNQDQGVTARPVCVTHPNFHWELSSERKSATFSSYVTPAQTARLTVLHGYVAIRDAALPPMSTTPSRLVFISRNWLQSLLPTHETAEHLHAERRSSETIPLRNLKLLTLSISDHPMRTGS